MNLPDECPKKGQNQKKFFSPKSWPHWLYNGHKMFSVLAILAKAIKVLSFIQIWPSDGDFGQASVSLLGDWIDILVCLLWNIAGIDGYPKKHIPVQVGPRNLFCSQFSLAYIYATRET